MILCRCMLCVCVCVCVLCVAALEYLKSHPVGEVDEEEFSQYCGVGIVVTAQQIHEQVTHTCHTHTCDTHTHLRV